MRYFSAKPTQKFVTLTTENDASQITYHYVAMTNLFLLCSVRTRVVPVTVVVTIRYPPVRAGEGAVQPTCTELSPFCSATKFNTIKPPTIITIMTH